MTNEAATNDRRIAHARLDWSEGAPHSTVFGDIYFSGDGAAETAHVFLEGNDLPRRFDQASRFSIGELGFGSGLNFLMAWELWRRTPKPERARLHFFSVEAFPLRPEDMALAHIAWPDLKALSARLRALSPPATAGTHSLPIAPDVTLTLAYGDAQTALARAEGGVDAWFFDGFSPAKNPEMWRAGLFAEAARLSNPGATFATFTVAGDVRRAIAAARFAAEKRPGYGRKKEMLAGRIDAPVKRSPRAPWFANANPQRLAPGARVAIIGGGVAGASLAYAARRGGLDPVIIEADAPAAGASGNPAGLIMPRLDLGDTPAARFFLLAYIHAVRLLSDLDQAGIFSSCGVLLGAEKAEQKERLARIAAAGLLPEDWLRQTEDVLLLPQAGVVDPAAFVRALIAETPVVKARARRIEEYGQTIETDTGRLGGFDATVLANGFGATLFAQARGLPLSRVAGQIDWFPDTAPPQRGLAFGPYAAPAPAGGLVIGATYDRLEGGDTPAPSTVATLANINAVRSFAPDIANRLDPARSRPRAGARCQTPDRLPVAGPLPDLGFYSGAYDGLRTGAIRDYSTGEMARGVYALTGLGSRGLVTAPLAAEMLVAEMTGQPSPVGHEIAQCLHPARFFIRDLKRAERRK
ncbi:MAG: bifunctional tRNA (5-methylaminomethyl-2-thiouridine)(34)-methyltransferase MnmD/FAD-dependent 5-carboxymethylaminomethyl-2-thiouridine(34) oxidoreductase MnmC [Amphiplicatus sp.]